MIPRSHSAAPVGCRSTRRAALFGVALLTLAAWLPLAVATAGAESSPEFRVIVHPDNPSTGLSREFLIDAFLKRSTRWSDGETIRPVDQRPDSAARRRFSELILQRSVAAVKSYWQQR